MSTARILVMFAVSIVEGLVLGVLGSALAGWNGVCAALLGAMVHAAAMAYTLAVNGDTL